MMEPLTFLWPAFLVAVSLVGIHAYFGIQVLARKVIFVDLALAQIAALGATVAFMLGYPAQSFATYGYSLAFTLLAAVLLAFTRAWGTRVPQEALIGVIYVVAAADAILLIDRAPQDRKSTRLNSSHDQISYAVFCLKKKKKKEKQCEMIELRRDLRVVLH